jgi:DNA modification methylase
MKDCPKCKAKMLKKPRHILMCGDSTSKDDVDRLMDGEKADMVFTSPPYNSGDGGYKTDYSGETKKFYKSKVDNRTEIDWVKFCDNVINAIPTRSDESPILWNVMYTARCRKGYGISMFGGGHNYTVKETICWQKSSGFPSASKGILSRNWELIFVLSGGEKYFTTQKEHEVRFNKWDIQTGNQHEDHKATFPVELPTRALLDFSIETQVVYEPFTGSGSTLIACEKTNRKCYGMEIDPHYVSVIIKRWQDFTGKVALKL